MTPAAISVVAMPEDRVSDGQAAAEQRMVRRRLVAGLPEAKAAESAAWQVTRSRELDSRLWSVRRGDQEAGTAWTLTKDGEVSHLLDLDVPPRDAAAAFAALATALRNSGSRNVVVDVFTGDEVTAAVLAGRDVPVEATQMLLDLSRPVTEPPRVRLHPMTAAEFGGYREHLVTSYAQDLVDAGSYPDDAAALAHAERSTVELLPDGVDSPRQHLWCLRDGDTDLGILWIEVDGPAGYIYDIEVLAEQRRRGYGREALDAGARAARDLGAVVLGLNVFGFNEAARGMYERAGYATTERTYRIPL